MGNNNKYNLFLLSRYLYIGELHANMLIVKR